MDFIKQTLCLKIINLIIEMDSADFILSNKKSEQINELTVKLPLVEACFVEVDLPNKKLLISSVLRPPNSNFNDFYKPK